MKTKLYIVLLSIFPLIAWAQTPNYEQEGDELFAQAQYERAIKKYNAAIELGAAKSQVTLKIYNANKCMSLENAAIEAENNHSYSIALELYIQLYELNAISSYKGKIALCKQRVKEEEELRFHKEAEEHQRIIAEQERRRIEQEERHKKEFREKNPDLWVKNRTTEIESAVYPLTLAMYKDVSLYKRTEQRLSYIYSIKTLNNYNINLIVITYTGNYTTKILLLDNQSDDAIMKFLIDNFADSNLKEINISSRPKPSVNYYTLKIYNYSIPSEQIAKDVANYIKSIRDMGELFELEMGMTPPDKLSEIIREATNANLTNKDSFQNSTDIAKTNILTRVLAYPCGVMTMSWKMPKSKLKKNLKSCYSDLSIDKNLLSGYLGDKGEIIEVSKGVTLQLIHVKIDLNAEKGKQVDVEYTLKIIHPSQTGQKQRRVTSKVVNILYEVLEQEMKAPKISDGMYRIGSINDHNIPFLKISRTDDYNIKLNFIVLR